MPDVTEKQILNALGKVLEPTLRNDLVSLGIVRNLSVCGGAVKFRLDLATPTRDAVRSAAESAVRAVPGVTAVTVETGAAAAAVSPLVRQDGALPGVRSIVAVASGKGGVGKSTLSANLALSLARRGRAVGLMDIDVYGPSIPGILGMSQPEIYADPDRKIVAPVQYGVKVISLGFWQKEAEATIVRGPILTQAVRQFLHDVKWGELDYLVCDLPPGTGDIPLSLAQMVPLTGVVIVATPQDVALRIAAKSITLFEKLNVDVLGIVENMSYFVCPHCGTRSEIFAHGGARKACEKFKVPFLGEVPLDIEVRIASDSGRPIVVSNPDSPQAKAFHDVAGRVEEEVAAADRRRASRPPPLVPVTFVRKETMEV